MPAALACDPRLTRLIPNPHAIMAAMIKGSRNDKNPNYNMK
jgi:hypothetical protein